MSAVTKMNKKIIHDNDCPLLNVNGAPSPHFHAAVKKNPVMPTLNEKPRTPVVLGYSATVIEVGTVCEGEINFTIDIDAKLDKERDNKAKGSDNEKYLLQLGEKQRVSSAAEGLLLMPNKDDVVLCVEIEGRLIINQVLKRKERSSPLVMSSSRPVEWVAPVLRFKALKEMELLAVNKLTLSASDLVFGAARTLVQQARNFIQQAKNYSLTTKDLLRLNGRQQVIIAEEDIRIDAKRINMG
ncbi:hypothetical protein IMCC1989_923 [gamma proteobacterium IMCC1989]|nr:hypothetical protein IMCC1989_923 [gamma proteobacterium IMCC1989]